MIAIIIFGCMGISIIGSSASPKSSSSPAPAAVVNGPMSAQITATPIMDANNLLQIEVRNATPKNAQKIVVLVQPQRAQVPPVRMTFRNVAAGLCGSASLR